ncbi:hypothetical protein HaLaN_07029 [Haematococcus lacustris]|uniref:Uncharacterized protein n=1 Tax=Haematococcus lacustris TaxID=44745 RepID=A0A699YNF2_HAELA|nr:hypothetical protein HaLaN_07029 [Haematococcus lacustris]
MSATAERAHKSPINTASTRKLHVLSGRLSRRDFFHTPAELRSDADLLAIDELLWAAPACSVMTRQARLRVAQQTTLMESEGSDVFVIRSGFVRLLRELPVPPTDG